LGLYKKGGGGAREHERTRNVSFGRREKETDKETEHGKGKKGTTGTQKNTQGALGTRHKEKKGGNSDLGGGSMPKKSKLNRNH